MYKDFIEFVKKLYPDKDRIPLHEPKFIGNEKKYVNECIDSSYVSSVGQFVDQFEEMLADKIGAKYVIATVNGTSALHIALILSNVCQNDEVITQPLTFVATCNAISYCRAHPVFIDIDTETLGLSPKALKSFLDNHAYIENNICYNKLTGRKIAACLPMHTFGHPCQIDQIRVICDQYHIKVIEDGAESLGSIYKEIHLGNFGQIAAISFNGNKIITAGGGGAVVTNDEDLAKKAKHLTTTAKIAHRWEFNHDHLGYNYRMPNINAALLCAQLEKLDNFLDNKRQLANVYGDFFKGSDWACFAFEPRDAKSNYWLNTLLLNDENQRDDFLKITNDQGIMTRPAWRLMSDLPMYKDAFQEAIPNAKRLEKIMVNIPSSVRL